MVAINSAPDRDPSDRGAELARLPLPPRSVLVSLRPIGVGTGMVESLWGYVVRLSAAHAVGLRDLWRFIAPAAGFTVSKAPEVSLKGERATSLSAVLEKLTLRRDVRQTTLATAEGNSGIVVKTSPTRAWCCTCLETDEVPYDRLLWNISLVGCCSIHGRPLRRFCPECGRSQPLRAGGIRILRCAWCRMPLTKGHELTGAVPIAYDLWASREIATVIAHFQAHSRNPGAIIANLETTVERCGGIKPMARQLRASPNSIRNWMRSTHGLALESVLRWAWLTSLSAVDLLCNEVRATDFVLRDAAPKMSGPTRRKRKTLSSEDFLLSLDKFLRERPLDVPSRAVIARILGTNVRIAAARTPRVIEAIAKGQHERRLAKRKAVVWRTVCEIYRAALWLSKAGRSITGANITAFLGSGLMRGHLAKRYTLTLRQQLNAGRIPPNPNTRLPQDVRAFWKHSGLI